jgi:hypothetical protein
MPAKRETPQPIHKTGSFWVSALISLALLAKPALDSFRNRALDLSGHNAELVIAALVNFAGVNGSRLRESDVYTPKGLPGKNKEDLDEAEAPPPTFDLPQIETIVEAAVTKSTKPLLDHIASEANEFTDYYLRSAIDRRSRILRNGGVDLEPPEKEDF